VRLTAPASERRIPGVSRAARLSRVSTRWFGAFSAATVGTLCLVIVPTTAQADGGLVAATNAARSAAGVGGLAESGDLDVAATQRARIMAQSGILAHTPHLGSGICCWSKLGENVGEGPSASAIHAAFMASPEHRANILDRSFNQMGVGYATDAHGTLWVAELFRAATGVAPPPAPAPVVHTAPRTIVHTTPRVTHPAVPTPAPVTKPVVPAAPVVAAPVVPAGPASRDLSRLPLDVAQRFAAQLAAGEMAAGDPVSRLLDFAAKASQPQS
jgi:uncharacterized protein YkwD